MKSIGFNSDEEVIIDFWCLKDPAKYPRETIQITIGYTDTYHINLTEFVAEMTEFLNFIQANPS